MGDFSSLPYSSYQLKDFQKGAIISLQGENFMKHQNGLFRFTPGLNFIFGLNGSGKSSIVCALILGLGGDPKITGRCSKIAQYITRGSTQARITIELSNGDGSTTTKFERIIAVKDGSSTTGVHNEYKIDRKKVSQEEYRNAVADFNVKVDNLCQVLPQERVAEFSNLNSQQLLLSTEQSIGDVDLYSDHQALIKADTEVRKAEKDIEIKDSLILKYKGFKAALEPNIERINETNKFEKEIEILNKKLLYMDFQNAREDFVSSKDGFNRIKKELDEFRQKSEEANNLSQHMGRILAKYTEKIQNQNNEFQTFINFGERVTTSSRRFRGEKKDILRRLRDNVENLKKRKIRLEKTNDEIEQEKERLEQLKQNNENHDQQWTELQNEIRQVEDNKIDIQALTDKKFRLRQEGAAAQRSIKYIQDNQDSNLGKCFSNAAVNANRLYLENRNRFSGYVCNILMNQIQIKKPEYAKYFERAIPRRDWEMFLFEEQDDMRLFRQILEENRAQKVPMSLVPDFRPDLLHNHPTIDQYKHCDVIGSLADCYSAPKHIQVYLNQTSGLHRLPVGGPDAYKHNDELKNAFRNLYTPNAFYTFMRSNYQQNVVTINDDKWKPVKVLNQLGQRQDTKQYFEKLEDIKNQLGPLEEEIKNAQQNQKKNDDRLKELNDKKHDLSRAMRLRETYEKDLKEKIREAKAIEKEIEKLSKIGQGDEKDNLEALNDDHTRQLKAFIKAVDKNCAAMQETFVLSQEHNIIEPLKAHYQAESLRNDRIQKDRENDSLQLKRAMDQAKRECQEKLEVLSEKTGLNFRDNNQPEVKELIAVFENYPETNEEIEASIESYQQKCNPYRNTNQNTLQQYNEYKEKIENEENLLIELHQKVQDEKTKIVAIKDGWVGRLKEIIKKIDKNYSNFMKKLGYEGTVALSNFGDQKFDECGISIRVKFRDSAVFSDLQSHSQSGGERSVATVVYMLALQEQAVVPFRIIDEINQGMDANNERNVFGLFDYVAEANHSQYFLLTPKIISGLKYTPAMSIVNILAFGKRGGEEAGQEREKGPGKKKRRRRGGEDDE